jgi:hypothetical protein
VATAVGCTALTSATGRSPLKASIPLFVIAGAAGVWLGLVLLVLRALGIPIT